jgi:hypothetical protein
MSGYRPSHPSSWTAGYHLLYSPLVADGVIYSNPIKLPFVDFQQLVVDGCPESPSQGGMGGIEAETGSSGHVASR